MAGRAGAGFLALTFVLALGLFGRGDSASPWLTNFAQAQIQARQSGKSILAVVY